MTKLNLIQRLKLKYTKKSFIFYNAQNGKIKDYKISDDFKNRKKYKYYRVVSTINNPKNI